MTAPFRAYDHVQLAMPPGGEATARLFYGGVCGMTEIEKPEPLGARGGVWFGSGGVALHLGVEPEFRASAKAHPAPRCADFDGLIARLRAAGVAASIDSMVPARCSHVLDPFGNRLELIADE